MHLHMALKKAQANYLEGTGIVLSSGSYSAWIEVVNNAPLARNPRMMIPPPNARMMSPYDQGMPPPGAQMTPQRRPSPPRVQTQYYDDEMPPQRRPSPPRVQTQYYEDEMPPQRRPSPPRVQTQYYEDDKKCSRCRSDLEDTQYSAYHPRETRHRHIRTHHPEDIFMDNIKQERAEVMLDIDRRNHRRQNMGVGMSANSSPSKGNT